MTGAIKEIGSVKDLLYCLLVFTFVTAAVTLIRRADLPSGPVLIPVLWGLGAVLPLRAGEGDLITFGLNGTVLMKNLWYFLASSLVVFPLYAAGFLLCVRWGFLLPVSTSFGGVSFPQWLWFNFLAIGLFEELFFRGFIQGRFGNYAGARFAGLRSVFWFPIFVSSLLFALAHVAADFDPAKIVIFFPGLLFGWLRAKTGTLLAPILSHGSANLVYVLLMGSVS